MIYCIGAPARCPWTWKRPHSVCHQQNRSAKSALVTSIESNGPSQSTTMLKHIVTSLARLGQPSVLSREPVQVLLRVHVLNVVVDRSQSLGAQTCMRDRRRAQPHARLAECTKARAQERKRGWHKSERTCVKPASNAGADSSVSASCSSSFSRVGNMYSATPTPAAQG